MKGATAEIGRLRRIAANTLRGLAMDAVQRANSGHPGMPMGMADVAVVLWGRFLSFDPSDPQWPDRDRFILSAGHGCMLLYGLLHLCGFDLPLEEIQRFRQWGSRTPGHPEYGLTPGVETTTGPLGQGFGNAVGIALAERWLATHFNRPGFPIVDHWTYVIASDGDLMEGISHEAASLAGHLGLGKLVVLYDDNRVTIDGPTELAFSEDVLMRFAAYGWHTQRVDGHDPEAVEAALESARRETARPSLIACRTHIGFGSPNRQDSAKAHGEPLGVEEVKLAKERLGLPQEEFYVPEEAKEFFRQAAERGRQRHKEWNELYLRYRQAFPELARLWEAIWQGELSPDWDRELPSFSPQAPLATRAASGAVLSAIFPRIPNLIGGSGDLTPSNNTQPKGEKAIRRDDFSGRYIHFGVREHAMGAILNGLCLHGGIRPYGGTFLVFSDYMRPSIRLAALMKLPVIYVFTHDSIGLGEDGPTHQPVEHLASLRAIPNLWVFRPADATETVVGWKIALTRREGPVALVLTRQAVPVLDRSQLAAQEGAVRGAYILVEDADFRAILLASGSEVHVALSARELLRAEGIGVRVVSMPCWELFEEQPRSYRESVLPPRIRARVAVEAARSWPWRRYVGLDGEIVGLDRFGASAPYKVVYEKLGITPARVVEAVKACLDRLAGAGH
ncbi:transketolase [Candidatus Methylacidithermus pantelleriae]|uniref:Transketolase n=1 Tax=Candidatus Methylacidithermus pantelleriae TaxID=2744239 RepID=A0A8J2BMQ7_9BACT|nr:transketolase [Candidatus Methylacidithermus pantelleriae]CAF0691396.1 Transketolase [Candidatus Methylacidithermus pantelleriae]